jgi:N-acetylglucosamine-6-sulfatase
MPPLPVHPQGRSRLLVLVVALLAVVLVVTGAVVAWWSGDDGGGPDTARGEEPEPSNSAEPAQLQPTTSPPPHQARRPNIVTILTDDMRTDDLRWMPNVRRLIEDEGLSFRNSFSPNPICAPARASLLSGQQSHNTGVFSVQDDNGFQAFDDRRTLATSLNSAGYNTLFLGKYINGYGRQSLASTGDSSFDYVPPGWTDWYGSVERPAGSGYPSGGTYSYYHVIYNVNGTIDDTYEKRYQAEVEGQISSAMVRKYHRSPKPFFMYLAPIAPHFGAPREKGDPVDVVWPDTGRHEKMKSPARPKDVRGRFDAEILRAAGLPRDGGPSERDVSDKPLPIRGLPELSPAERVAVRSLTRQRAETLFAYDRQIGRLVQTLKSTGEYRNTVLMFTSDNGYFLGEHRVRQGKIKAHEPSLRVPFLIAGPGVPHGDRFDPITTDDITATIVDIARARPPHPPDGRSVVPSFQGDRGWKVPVLTEGVESSSTFDDRSVGEALGFDDTRTTIGIRTSRWKYIRYVNGEGELYDLDRDPTEQSSVYGRPRYAEVQSQLHRLWMAYKDCEAASCRTAMPRALQREPARNEAGTQRQARGFEERFGYVR